MRPFTPKEDAQIINWRLNQKEPVAYSKIASLLGRRRESVRQRALVLGCPQKNRDTTIARDRISIPETTKPKPQQLESFIKPPSLARLMAGR